MTLGRCASCGQRIRRGFIRYPVSEEHDDWDTINVVLEPDPSFAGTFILRDLATGLLEEVAVPQPGAYVEHTCRTS